MSIRDELVDGHAGHTGAQYINAAYGECMRNARTNARFTSTGTIVATKRINAGTEILMAYGRDYWRVHRDTVSVASECERVAPDRNASNRCAEKTCTLTVAAEPTREYDASKPYAPVAIPVVQAQLITQWPKRQRLARHEVVCHTVDDNERDDGVRAYNWRKGAVSIEQRQWNRQAWSAWKRKREGNGERDGVT